MSDSDSAFLFRVEFLDKDLLEFDECKRYYESMPSEALVREFAVLFRPDVMAIPFGFTGRRYYAYLSALIDCVADWRGFSDKRRSDLISAIIALRDYCRIKTVEKDDRHKLDAALAAQLERVRTFGLFPAVADLIAARTTNYAGKFTEGAVGRVLEKRDSRSK